MVAAMSMKVMSSVVLLMSLNLIFTLLDVQAIDSIRFMNHIDRHLKRPKGKTKKGKSSAGSTKGPKKGKKTKGKSMNKGTTLSAPTITPSVVVKSNPVTTVPSGSPSTSPTKVPSDRPSTSPTESTQRIALTNFYNGISVGTRSALTNWLVGDECNTDNPWNGITCVDGQVTRLDLCKCKKDPIVLQISTLSHCFYSSIGQQGLSGTISPYLGNITSLVYVYLSEYDNHFFAVYNFIMDLYITTYSFIRFRLFAIHSVMIINVVRVEFVHWNGS